MILSPWSVVGRKEVFALGQGYAVLYEAVHDYVHLSLCLVHLDFGVLVVVHV